MELKQSGIIILRVEANGELIKQIIFYDSEKEEMERIYRQLRAKYLNAMFSFSKPLFLAEE